ncbi:MAG TPA: alternative ribosome rescue aminoacyl-tRNA hydrolase ArfB [Acidobacteriota bacterium]|nr:alternative ribosome rescue aminoacyl-tRNA hydrolase ArfB [Acidobacteriota bacterium]
MLKINERLTISADEIQFVASRGGGPGGQHINKVSSRVTLRFDVAGSSSLDDRDRDRLLAVLAPRISTDGVLQISSHASRSQAANKADVIERFQQLLADALRQPKKRRATRPSRGERRRRLEGKRHRAKVKRSRGKVRASDE